MGLNAWLNEATHLENTGAWNSCWLYLASAPSTYTSKVIITWTVSSSPFATTNLIHRKTEMYLTIYDWATVCLTWCVIASFDHVLRCCQSIAPSRCCSAFCFAACACTRICITVDKRSICHYWITSTIPTHTKIETQMSRTNLIMLLPLVIDLLRVESMSFISRNSQVEALRCLLSAIYNTTPLHNHHCAIPLVQRTLDISHWVT